MLEHLTTLVTGAVVVAVLLLHVQLQELEGLATFLTELGLQPDGLMATFPEKRDQELYVYLNATSERV